MAIYDLSGTLSEYGDGFLILEFNHLFISSSIREEVWLLQRKDDPPLINKVIQAAREFGIREVSGSYPTARMEPFDFGMLIQAKKSCDSMHSINMQSSAQTA